MAEWHVRFFANHQRQFLKGWQATMACLYLPMHTCNPTNNNSAQLQGFRTSIKLANFFLLKIFSQFTDILVHLCFLNFLCFHYLYNFVMFYYLLYNTYMCHVCTGLYMLK